MFNDNVFEYLNKAITQLFHSYIYIPLYPKVVWKKESL